MAETTVSSPPGSGQAQKLVKMFGLENQVRFLIDGVCDGPRAKPNQKSGEVRVSTNVEVMGARYWISLEDAGQEDTFKDGDRLTLLARVTEYNGEVKPGKAKILLVNGQQVV